MKTLQNGYGIVLGTLGVATYLAVTQAAIASYAGTFRLTLGVAACTLLAFFAVWSLAFYVLGELIRWVNAPVQAVSDEQTAAYESESASLEAQVRDLIAAARHQGDAKFDALVAARRDPDSEAEKLATAIRSYPDPNRLPLTPIGRNGKVN